MDFSNSFKTLNDCHVSGIMFIKSRGTLVQKTTQSSSKNRVKHQTEARGRAEEIQHGS